LQNINQSINQSQQIYTVSYTASKSAVQISLSTITRPRSRGSKLWWLA